MSRVKKITVFALATLMSPLLQVNAMQVHKSDKGSMDVFGRMQMLGEAERIKNKEKTTDDNRVFLFMPQARLGTDGNVEDYRYHMELGFGAEESVTSNVSLNLLDLRFDVPVTDGVYLRVGQFKVPYGRESLADDGQLQFSRRSINNLGFMLGRDVGGAVVVKRGAVSGALGVFTGGARDTPERYLPEKLRIPLTVLRLGFDSTSADAMGDHQSGVFDVKGTETALYLNAAYTKDSNIGHSSVLNVRPTDKPLILIAGWNPYLASKAKARYMQAGLDGIVRSAMGEYVTAVEGQIDTARYNDDNKKQLRIWGARVQVSAAKKPYELAIRGAVIKPDSRFSNGNTDGSSVTGSKPFYEITPSLTYYLKDWSKLIFQASAMINTPVSNEIGLGSYLLVEQPDTAASMYAGTPKTTKGTFDRKFVPIFQAMWQMSF